MDLSIDELKSNLTMIIRNEISKFTLVNLAKKLNLSLNYEDSFFFQKKKVENEILQHIVQKDQSAQFVERLDETKKWLGSNSDIGYSCTFTGCVWNGSMHRQYIEHVRRVHFLNKNILCNFRKKCPEQFDTVQELTKHTDEHHKKNKKDQTLSPQEKVSQKSGIELNMMIPSRCNLCSKIFHSLKHLMTHYNTVHFYEHRPCIFKNCQSEFNPESISSQHFLNHHKRKGALELKEEFCLLDQTSQIRVDNLEDEINCNPGYEADEDNENEDNEVCESAESECEEEETRADSEKENFLKVLCDFYNRLSHTYMVPHSTVQFIANQFLKISIKARVETKQEVENKLHTEQISELTIKEVLKVLDNDSFLDAQQSLTSQYKRNQCLKENFKFIEPTEIVLNKEAVKKGAKKECFHYVNIIDSFRALIEDKNVIDAIEETGNEKPSDDDLLSDIKDGSLYKNLDYFKQNPEALVGTFYSDAIEIVSPLGAGKGRQKLLQVFWSLAEIPKHLRSKVDVIQLAIVVKESLVKKYGYSIIYKQLIEDMCKLEEGIDVEFPFRRKVKIGFPLHLGDNLECHSVGGFRTCFSSGHICRFCKIQHSQLKHNIHDYTSLGRHEYFTVEEYDEICNRIEEKRLPVNFEFPIDELENHLFDEMSEPVPMIIQNVINGDEDEDEQESGESQNYGIRNRCPFNKLAAFHATFSLPPDLLHDFLEGNDIFLFTDLKASLITNNFRSCLRGSAILSQNSHS